MNLVYAKPSVVLKNPEAVARFIEYAYSDGKNFPVFEEIVEKISALKVSHGA